MEAPSLNSILHIHTTWLIEPLLRVLGLQRWRLAESVMNLTLHTFPSPAPSCPCQVQAALARCKDWAPALLCFFISPPSLQICVGGKKSISIWHADDLVEFAQDHFTSNGYNQKTEDAIRARYEIVVWMSENGDFRGMAWHRGLSAINQLSPEEVDFLLQVVHSDKILSKHQIRLCFRAPASLIPGPWKIISLIALSGQGDRPHDTKDLFLAVVPGCRALRRQREKWAAAGNTAAICLFPLYHGAG